MSNPFIHTCDRLASLLNRKKCMIDRTADRGQKTRDKSYTSNGNIYHSFIHRYGIIAR